MRRVLLRSATSAVLLMVKPPQHAQHRWCATTGKTPLDLEALAKQIAELREAANLKDAASGAATATTSKAAAVPHSILRSVVKIYASVSAPNSLIPWQRKLQNNVTGTGFLVDRKRRLIITNAHVVAFTTFVEVRKHGDSHRYTGYIVYIGADCDLALVHIADPAFWAEDAMEPLAFEGAPECSPAERGVDQLTGFADFAGLPALQEDVKVVGYPMGGDQISITSGVVSRIDVTAYGGVGTNLLTIQLDAAINSGNSGGPAISRSKVIGIAFQTLINAESIGYIIPNPVLSVFFRTFIKCACEKLLLQGGDAATAHRSYHPGFCSLGIFYQEMANKALRDAQGLPPTATGILIRDVLPTGAAVDALKVGDVITHVEGTAVANDATIEWRPRERLRFNHLVKMRLPEETIKLGVWRAGQQIEVTLVSKLEQLLVPNHTFDDVFREQPKYRVFGGFVFSTVTIGLLLEWGANDWYNAAPRWLTELVSVGRRTPQRDEAIVIVQKLPHDVNKGYNAMGNRIVTHLDGIELRSLAHMQQVLDDAIKSKANDSNAFVTFSVTHGNAHDHLVLPIRESMVADQHLQAIYHIPHLRHEELVEAPAQHS